MDDSPFHVIRNDGIHDLIESCERVQITENQVVFKSKEPYPLIDKKCLSHNIISRRLCISAKEDELIFQHGDDIYHVTKDEIKWLFKV